MNAVHTRPRRWSSRLNNNAAASNASSNSTPNSLHMGSNNGCDPMCYPKYAETESRVIYETPGVTLRPLPFYDAVDDLIRPAGLMSDGVLGRLNESTVEFRLTTEQADQLAMSPDTRLIILRFCYLDSSCEQEDNFPPDVQVLVNNSTVPLPPAISNPNRPNIPPKRPGQHVDITKNCKLCPYLQNQVTVKWFVDPLEPSRSYVINIVVADKLNSETLLDRIKSRGLSDPEQTKRFVVDSDNEVSTTNLQSSLVCPLGKMRMTMPCKANTCQHITCFDALFYLQMNERKAQWTCPVCYRPALFRDLMIDGYFMSILQNSDPSVTEVTLASDGSWSPVLKMEQPASANKPGPEIITISDDDD